LHRGGGKAGTGPGASTREEGEGEGVWSGSAPRGEKAAWGRGPGGWHDA
jgi:hypothetical protein